MRDEKGRPGPKVNYPEKTLAAFRPGTVEAIRELCGQGETKADFIRKAVDREIERRSKRWSPA